jgi:hypothetical protein
MDGARWVPCCPGFAGHDLVLAARDAPVRVLVRCLRLTL